MSVYINLFSDLKYNVKFICKGKKIFTDHVSELYLRLKKKKKKCILGWIPSNRVAKGSSVNT